EDIIYHQEPVSVPVSQPVVNAEPQPQVPPPVIAPPVITQKPKSAEYAPPQNMAPPTANRNLNNTASESIFKGDETGKKKTKNLESPGSDRKNILDKMNV